MDSSPPYDTQRLRHLAGEIITNVRELSHAGWTPATSSRAFLSSAMERKDTTIMFMTDALPKQSPSSRHAPVGDRTA